jgi:anti-sigma factor RsiW
MSSAPVREEALHAYVDDQLDPAERGEVERYLAANAAEAERVAAYQEQRRLLQNAFEPVLQEPVPPRLMSRPRAALSWRRIAAVCAWIALGAALGWGVRDQQEPASATAESELVHRARTAHVIYSAETRRAVEIAASQEQDMIRWLSKRMNAAVRVPNLTEFGFEAMGGRLLPGKDGPACQLMYQNADGKRLTIYLSRDAVGARPVHYSDQDRVHVIFWSDGTLAFAVSAELGRDELVRIAAAVARASRIQGG